MTEDVRFVPAGTLALDRLAELFERSFEGYFYPAQIGGAELAWRVRLEQIDLWRSPVMLVGAEQAGLALLARRAERTWCAGFGVTAAYRGRGHSHQLAAELIRLAHESGARELVLEVLTRNERAIRTYLRAGFRSVRDLLILEWRRPDDHMLEPIAGVAEAEPAAMLRHFDALHPVPAAWQRDLPTLLTRDSLGALCLGPSTSPHGYVLFQPRPDGSVRVADLAAPDATLAQTLLIALQLRFNHILTINEPDDAPHTPAFLAAGFVEIDRQHEMVRQLAPTDSSSG